MRLTARHGDLLDEGCVPLPILLRVKVPLSGTRRRSKLRGRYARDGGTRALSHGDDWNSEDGIRAMIRRRNSTCCTATNAIPDNLKKRQSQKLTSDSAIDALCEGCGAAKFAGSASVGHERAHLEISSGARLCVDICTYVRYHGSNDRCTGRVRLG